MDAPSRVSVYEVERMKMPELKLISDEPEPDGVWDVMRRPDHAGAAAGASPRLNARICSIASGFGGTFERLSANASRSSESDGFHRRSNAIVLLGLPLRPTPHTEPAKWPG